jgi:RNA polymerase sigma-70 factor (ECF subfamily)
MLTNTTRDSSGSVRVAHEDDATLIVAAREDPAAFDVLYRRYVTRIYRYCYSRTENAAVAEDLTAQTFLAALESIGTFRGDGSVAAWLFGIASNVCKGYHRYRQRHPQEPLETVAQRKDAETADPERRAYRRGILDCAQRVLPQLSTVLGNTPSRRAT